MQCRSIQFPTLCRACLITGCVRASAATAFAAAQTKREGSMLTRRALIAAGVAAPFVAKAQSWPSGNIRIVVPYPPAGSTDAIMRLVQAPLQQRLGATIIIENRPG